MRLLQAQELGGGAVAGALRFQNQDLVQARTQLGQMAAALAGTVNAQQALGLDQRRPAGQRRADLSRRRRAGACPS